MTVIIKLAMRRYAEVASSTLAWRIHFAPYSECDINIQYERYCALSRYPRLLDETVGVK
jgi:hypothetical protein